MKHFISIFSVAVMLLFAASCSHGVTVERPLDELAMRTLTLDLNAVALSTQLQGMRNSVSLEDVQKYLDHTSPKTKGGEKGYEIIPQVDEENDTLFYLVNYEKGWKLIAADRRVQPIVAESSESSFDGDILTPGMGLWLNIAATDMKVIKRSSDEMLNISKEEQEFNKLLWASICDVDVFVKSQRTKTKAGPGPDHPPIPNDDGMFVLDTTIYTYVVYDSLDHLIPTTWSQEEGFNQCCPFRTDTITKRARAGCVPVAVGQILYYLHNYLGRPILAPSTGTCTGFLPDSYSLTLGDYSSTVWDGMQMQYPINATSAAPLLAELGEVFNIEYKNDESSVSLSDIVPSAFWYYGINCDPAEVYDENEVCAYLLDDLPVLVTAFGTRIQRPFHDYEYADGHAFIIDGYKRYRIQTTQIYKWVYYDNTVMHPLPPDDYYEVTYSSPVISNFRINWGAGYQCRLVWYSMTGNWHIDTYDYDYDRKMINNFRIWDGTD